MRYKCTCMYDGSLFHGFQTQENLRTIQEEIEKALLIINKKKTPIHASGRTDVGVHAIGQVFHFDSDIEMENWAMKNAINSRIPKDILITNVVKVSDDFHSRKSAISKEYHYLIDFGPYDPFLRNYRYFCHYHNFDFDMFEKALQMYVGEHDFRSFTKNHKKENTIRTIYKIEVLKENTLVTIKIIGNGFLHNMVRILIAMALEVGRGKITLEQLKAIMDAKNRQLSPKIVPSNGLYLYQVNY